jgi:hypothetical protein
MRQTIRVAIARRWPCLPRSSARLAGPAGISAYTPAGAIGAVEQQATDIGGHVLDFFARLFHSPDDFWRDDLDVDDPLAG